MKSNIYIIFFLFLFLGTGTSYSTFYTVGENLMKTEVPLSNHSFYNRYSDYNKKNIDEVFRTGKIIITDWDEILQSNLNRKNAKKDKNTEGYSTGYIFLNTSSILQPFGSVGAQANIGFPPDPGTLDDTPLSDGIPVLLLLLGSYLFVKIRKQKLRKLSKI